MSLIKCPECGKDMSDKAPSCPNCGYVENSFLSNFSKPQPKLGCFGVICLIVIAFYLMSLFGDDKPKTITYSKEDREWDAYYTATQFVEKRLKAPKTAEFPNSKYASVQLLEDGATYKVYAYVDAENSFGAKIRSNWYAKLILKGKQWQLLDLQIYDK